MTTSPPVKFDLATQTLYSELLDRVRIREARRSLGSAPGTFVTKSIRDAVYYYFQASLPGGQIRQAYIGRKSPSLDEWVARYASEKATMIEEDVGLSRLCAQLRMGDALATEASAIRVLKALGDAGLFHSGAVLVGSHAMPVLGNVLGVKWASEALRTQDIDIALPPVQVAIPDRSGDIPSALDRLKMGFLPVPALDPRKPSSSFKVRGRDLRVDILTTTSGKSEKPVYIPRWKTAAHPLPFLDFLIETPISAAVINGSPVFVQVPQPARFALHKLIVQGERWAGDAARSRKDVFQSGQILSVLVDERPGDVLLAWDEIRKRGGTWVRKLERGIQVLDAMGFPAVSHLKKLIRKE